MRAGNKTPEDAISYSLEGFMKESFSIQRDLERLEELRTKQCSRSAAPSVTERNILHDVNRGLSANGFELVEG
jgi:hypothetical protein